MKDLKLTDILLAIVLMMCAACTGCGRQDYSIGNGKPNVLVIGDSISGGYVLPLSYKLRNEYNVTRITATSDPSTWIDNCRNTTYTLQNLDTWLARFPNNQIIIWNNGIWNAATTPGPEDLSHYYTPPAQYESEIQQIAQRLKATGARVIFLTTTQISPADTRATVGLNTQFNDIAKRVLPQYGVEIHDLWDFTIDHPDWHVTASDLHFNGLANEFLADWLAPIVRGK